MVRYFKIIALLHNWHALKDIIVLEYDVIIHKVENLRLGHNYIYTRERRNLSKKNDVEWNLIRYTQLTVGQPLNTIDVACIMKWNPNIRLSEY